MAFQLTATDLGRRFGRPWVFRHLGHTFRAGEPTALLGPNGAGKSTLLAVLAHWLPATEGTVTYERNGQTLDPAQLYRHTAFAAPYLELPEELTVLEAADFQGRLKPWRATIRGGAAEVVACARLDGPAAHKRVRDLSSGMRQRLRLALALLSNAELVLLDEPTSNLDRAGIAWYHELIQATALGTDRLVLVASNVAEEYDFCHASLDVRREP